MLLADSLFVAETLADVVPRSATSVQLLIGILLMAALGLGLCFGALVLGRFVRPQKPNTEKLAIYECGEPTIGSGWIQFDLRFYVVALVFIVFDVEIALFWPWAVVYGGGGGTDPAELASVKMVALCDMLFFFGVIVVGFLYLWRFGYLDWVRSTISQTHRGDVAALGGTGGAAKE